MKDRSTGAQGALEVFVFPFRLLTAIFICSSVLSAASAQGNSALHESQRAAHLRALNNSILQLHGQVQENATSLGALRGQAAQVLAQRASALETLIEEDPHAALTFAFSADLISDLVEKFPGSALQLESHVTLNGTIEHWITDSADLKSSREAWFLNAGGSRLELHFGTQQRPAPNSGPVLTIEGVRLGSHVAVARIAAPGVGISGSASRGMLGARSPLSLFGLLFAGLALAWTLKMCRLQLRSPFMVSRFAGGALALVFFASTSLVASAQTCSTTGVQNIAVLLVSFADKPVPVSPQQATYDFFGGNSGPSLNGYWQEASYGQTSAV